MPKQVNPAVRARAVRLVSEHRQEHPSVMAAAGSKQRGLGRETVRRWVVQADVDPGRRDGCWGYPIRPVIPFMMMAMVLVVVAAPSRLGSMRKALVEQ